MINLYAHGGSGNHGCEALVRSTLKMIDSRSRLFSRNFEEDKKYIGDLDFELHMEKAIPLKKWSREWVLSKIETKLMSTYYLTVKYQYKQMLSKIKKGDICLSIGGDNYCYDGADLLALMNRGIRSKGAKTVLWGCSVEPEQLNIPIIKNDIATYDLITARETISYEALKKINENTILVSDPAFTLDRVDLPLPKGWVEGKMIGINASPLILNSGTDKSMVFDAYIHLIQNIIAKTDFNIVLVPHVVWENNDDRIVLQELYNCFKETKRIIILDDCNCMELKGFIARCRMFIGARTHATIAAYSTCVPTLVLGYSVKSRGIATDIFGTEKNFVIPVQDITNNQQLVDGFLWLKDHEKEIKEHLEKTMPNYIEKAYIAKNVLEKL